MFSLFGESWVMPKSVVQMLVCWHGRFHNHRGAKAWKAAPLFIMWSCGLYGEKRIVELLMVLNAPIMLSNNPC